jgi:hypothetical protein
MKGSDHEAKIIYQNHGACSSCGFSAAALVGLPIQKQARPQYPLD